MSFAFIAGFALQALVASDVPRPLATRLEDSVRVRHEARDAQASFELRRVSLLPVKGDRGGSNCEQRIGRMCYTWEGRADPAPPAEPAAIADLRDKLLRELESATLRLPGDEWLFGQYVRYLIEADRTGDAQRAAETECRAQPWWCEALAGWAAHEGERFGQAEAAYDRALTAMSVRERCRWEDASVILERARAARQRRLTCDARRSEVARVMWLARPLYSADGNDLLTEHYARLTAEGVLRESRTPHGMAWGDDLRQLLVRYGWSTSWSRNRSSSYAARSDVSGQSRSIALNFFPVETAIDHPALLGDSTWRLQEPLAVTRYAPRWATTVTLPGYQLARFVRADTAIVLAAYDVGADTTFADSLDATLSLVPAHPGSIAITRIRGARQGRLMARAPLANAEIASVELLDRKRRAASRARTAIALDRSAPSLSDMLLIDATVLRAGSATLERAAEAMLTSSSVRTATKVGVYWEVYDLRAVDAIGDVALSLQRERSGAFRRAAEAMGIVDRALPVTLEWRDNTRGSERVLPRSVVVDLVGVPAGRYTLALLVRVGGRTLRATRMLTVTGR